LKLHVADADWFQVKRQPGRQTVRQRVRVLSCASPLSLLHGVSRFSFLITNPTVLFNTPLSYFMNGGFSWKLWNREIKEKLSDIAQ